MDSSQILKKCGLKVTKTRRAVLELFLNREQSLCYSEIELMLPGDEFDKVTIYRTLEHFISKDIIHKVSNDTTTQFFALNYPDSSSKTRQHLHFLCDVCNASWCITTDSLVNAMNLPFNESFNVSDVELLIHGTCKTCS